MRVKVEIIREDGGAKDFECVIDRSVISTFDLGYLVMKIGAVCGFLPSALRSMYQRILDEDPVEEKSTAEDTKASAYTGGIEAARAIAYKELEHAIDEHEDKGSACATEII